MVYYIIILHWYHITAQNQNEATRRGIIFTCGDGDALANNNNNDGTNKKIIIIIMVTWRRHAVAARLMPLHMFADVYNIYIYVYNF